jgi:hypothetical protein
MAGERATDADNLVVRVSDNTEYRHAPTVAFLGNKNSEPPLSNSASRRQEW